jgi:hypothetical protein
MNQDNSDTKKTPVESVWFSDEEKKMRKIGTAFLYLCCPGSLGTRHKA